jgi:ZIP family zinc transporter
LSFAAEAVIFVVIEYSIPQCQREVNMDIVAMAAIGGFMVVMILDVASG